MSNKLDASRDLSRATMAALMLAVFIVSIGVGVVLPLLLLDRAGGTGG